MVIYKSLFLFSYFSVWVLAQVDIIEPNPVDGMGPKMTRVKASYHKHMNPCDILHETFEIDPSLHCVEHKSEQSDEIGRVAKLTQTKDGIRLQCADIRINHHYENGITHISGEFYLRPPPQFKTNYEPDEAVDLAIEAFQKHSGLEKGAIDQDLKKYIDRTPSSQFICTSSMKPQEMKLSYKVDLNHRNPLNRSSVYIDAHSGQTIKLVKHARAVTETLGFTLTGYYGSKEITVTQSADGDTYLAKQTLNKEISLFNCVEDETCPIVANTNNLNFGTIARDQDQLMAAYWGMEQTWELFQQFFDRKGYDNLGSPIQILGTRLNNSVWTPGEPAQVSFGFLTAFDLSSIDIVAHQFMHGVIDTDIGLNLQNEPGTIAQSIADCFGVFVHASILGNSDYWLMGSETRLFTRSLKNPKQFKQPDTFEGQYWYDGTDDDGGIHQNSGVLNKMYYFMAAGGAGINDQGNVYNVTAIAIQPATRVIYRATTNYLTQNSNFKDYRNAVARAGFDLYGEQGQQTAHEAFYAVGIGEEPEHVVNQRTIEAGGASSFGAGMQPLQMWITVMVIFALFRHS